MGTMIPPQQWNNEDAQEEEDNKTESQESIIDEPTTLIGPHHFLHSGVYFDLYGEAEYEQVHVVDLTFNEEEREVIERVINQEYSTTVENVREIARISNPVDLN